VHSAQGLALVGERRNPTARGVLVIMLAEFGDACRLSGTCRPPSRLGTGLWQVRDDLGWPDLLEVSTRLERVGLPSPRR